MIELLSTDASVSLAVLSAGGRATQPCDVGLRDSLKTQLFEDVGSWNPRLIVAYLPDWTPEVSELARELVQRQRAEGLDGYPINTTLPLPLSHVEVELHVVYGTLDGRAADTPQETTRAATTRASADPLSECGQQEASASQALISFSRLVGNSEDRVKKILFVFMLHIIHQNPLRPQRESPSTTPSWTQATVKL